MAAAQTTTLAVTLRHMLGARPVTNHRKLLYIANPVQSLLILKYLLVLSGILLVSLFTLVCCVLTEICCHLCLCCTLGNGQRNGSLLLLSVSALHCPG